MAENRSRFVLLCQQSLALAVVVAVAAPAANLVSLDIVAPPAPGQVEAVPSGPADPSSAGLTRSVVDSAPVRSRVTSVPLLGVEKAGVRTLRQGARASLVSATTAAGQEEPQQDVPASGLAVLSAPQRVDGLATIGVTWSRRAHLPESAIDISVRTLRDKVWSTWKAVPYHEEDAPDPTSAEGRSAHPGTDPVYVGDVDDVQVRATTASGRAPAGMRLALVDPGADRAPVEEAPGIDTGADTGAQTGTGAGLTLSSAPTASLAAGAVTPKPVIWSRSQWGADERMRDKASLHYGEVHGGFVHHTVNANSYTRAQVPAIIRGIYAYHTQSRGWSDVGYNFLVDRFGRIWEGRYGGVDRPVVGAHTLGYNDDAFAASAIGNYDIARPPAAVVAAYGRLFAWKLALHGVRASSTRQYITKRYLPAINGHRDVGQTACPGRYLYAKIPEIRRQAAAAQRSWAGRARRTTVAGLASPAVVARDRATGQAFLIRSTSHGTPAGVTATGAFPRAADLLLNAGDWDGDGLGDVVTRSGRTGLLFLYRGTRSGKLRAPTTMSRASFAKVRLLAAVGDMTGDGRPDLLGQPSRGSMRIYPGNGSTGFGASYVAHAAITGAQQLGVGLWNADGAPDSVVRRSDGTLVLYPGNGPGGLTGGQVVGRVSTSNDWAVVVGDVTGDGRSDLVLRDRRSGELRLRRGTASGFAPRHLFAAHQGRYDLAG
jgi:hypothetical protein